MGSTAGYPHQLATPVKNCTEFTLHLEVVVNYGDVHHGDWTVYGKNERGQWIELGDFNIPESHSFTQRFVLDEPTTITELFFSCAYYLKYSYSSNVWLTDVHYAE